MKNNDLDSILLPHITAIRSICDDLGAPIGGFRAHMTRNILARLGVVLADTDPGWRRKDIDRHGDQRRTLKRRIREHLLSQGLDVAVYIQAGYSCLTVEDGTVVRRDESGNVIGAHQP